MAVKNKLEEKFSLCEVCQAGLGNLRMDTPLYCISCIEEMEKLNMSLKKYRKYREIQETLGKK